MPHASCPDQCIPDRLCESDANPRSPRHPCREHALPEGYRHRANRFAPGYEDSFRMALQAGVKIASGSDQGPSRGAALLEIEFLIFAACGW
jgi:imidazolonepropionase-like amidohydrolase